MTHQRIDDWGRVVLNESGLLEVFYKGLDPHDFLVDDSLGAHTFNSWCEVFDKNHKKLVLYQPLSEAPASYHARRQNDWLMPDKYKSFDIEQWLRDQCVTDQQKTRVNAELELFAKHQMCDVLRLLRYMVITLRENKVMWGVGRGSSVASYCLFLIGVHKVDSLKYDLPISEFIKE